MPLPPELDPRGRHRGRPAHGGRTLRPLGRTLGALLAVGLIVLAGYYWLTYRNINKHLHRLQVVVGQKPTAGNETDIDGKDQNILVIGNDDRSNLTNTEVRSLHVGRDGGSLATDTMMIVHIPADGRKATLISLPRDSYVKIPGYGTDRLNAAYADAYGHTRGPLDKKRTAGANLLLRTITNLTGLTIDHYVQVDLIGFYRISNAIGGVTVNLCHAVDDTVAHNRAEGSDGGSGLVLPRGRHVIKGVQALEFVRQRHNLPNGDLDRVRRQQYFLTAAFRKVVSGSTLLFKLQSLGDAVTKSIYVDPSLNLLTLAKQMQNLTANNIVGRTIPTSPETIDGKSVLAVRPARVQAFVDKVINPPKTATKPSPRSAARTTHPGSSRSSTPAAIDSKCIN